MTCPSKAKRYYSETFENMPEPTPLPISCCKCHRLHTPVRCWSLCLLGVLSPVSGFEQKALSGQQEPEGKRPEAAGWEGQLPPGFPLFPFFPPFGGLGDGECICGEELVTPPLSLPQQLSALWGSGQERSDQGWEWCSLKWVLSNLSGWWPGTLQPQG